MLFTAKQKAKESLRYQERKYETGYPHKTRIHFISRPGKIFNVIAYLLMEADLVDMSSLNKENDGVNYLLTCIDTFSKYAWVIPLRNKNASALVEAFKKIFKDERYPKILYTDKGTEFSNRSLKKL